MKASKMAVSTLSALALMMAAGTAMAEGVVTPIDVTGGTIHFNGVVTDGACTVDQASSDQNVPLGSMQVKDVVKGQPGKSMPFSIVLQDCSIDTYTNASFSFNGQPDTKDPSALANNYGAGGAQGVGVQMKDMDGKVVTFGNAGAKMKLIKGTNVASFSAALYGTDDATNVKSGYVTAMATFNVHYE
ncbi:Type-1 fimbrial protein, A chain precursor [compost metagenome]|jgi:major type 1 subunit fimbrin (pilin)|uniref:fimbrial protein n=1 Tax=Lelliottia aquatilis TaxID=2080838 RepID=UPI000CDF0556|nr:fimbrial protein [Lelliottia aquatilis]MBL5884417.1 fimbrial protein [Lelliottia aquatilis]POZ17553.1 type-1 fimbrial protein subunit A [Lelliottia aquatilis]